MVKLLFLPTLSAPDACEKCGPLAAAVLVSVLVSSDADICIQGNFVLLFGCLSDSGVSTNYNDNNVIIFFINLVILALRTLLMPLWPTVEFISF